MLDCTCIIPFYNEDERLLNTLTKLQKVPNLKQIICINDGSTNPTTTKAIKQLKTFPRVTLLNHTTNQGKSAAVLTGLKAVKTKWVFLLDADLNNLQPTELQRALELVEQHQNQLDMLILRRAPYSKFVKAIRHDILMSGERILKTNDLLAIYNQIPFEGYQLEVAINHHMRRAKKSCYWLQASFTNTYKLHKWGLQKSILKYANEISGYTGYAGTRAYLQQVMGFCKQSILELSK